MKYDDEELTEEELKDIEKAINDIKRGKYKTSKQLEEELGLND